MFDIFKGKKKAKKEGEEKKKKAPATKKKTTSKKKASPKKTTTKKTTAAKSKVPAGLETRTQIKQFQLANGLPPTGLLDEATLEKAKK